MLYGILCIHDIFGLIHIIRWIVIFSCLVIKIMICLRELFLMFLNETVHFNWKYMNSLVSVFYFQKLFIFFIIGLFLIYSFLFDLFIDML